MINQIPDNWVYSNKMEMLWFFYQRVDEMLSTNTIDTYSVPLHNTITLFHELVEVDSILKQFGLEETYFENYLTPIIDELLNSLKQDFILKHKLDKRLLKFMAGFEESKKNSAVLSKWIPLFMQAINEEEYIDLYKTEISELIIDNKRDKKKLEYCIRVLFSELLFIGYNREYLYQYTKRFFHNKNVRIENPLVVKQYLATLDCMEHEQSFLISMDISEMEYLDSITEKTFLRGNNIVILDDRKKLDDLSSDRCVAEFIERHERAVSNSNAKQTRAKMAIVSYTTSAYDEYSAISSFDDFTRFLHVFSRYFKHYSHPKIIKDIIYKRSSRYVRITIPSKMLRRPYIDQSSIDSRVQNILSVKSLSSKALNSLFLAMQMHSETLDSQDIKSMVRSFWAALETLFLEPQVSNNRRNVENSLIPVIQKTYLLKVFRKLFADLMDATSMNKLKSLGINDFEAFLLFFSNNDVSSEQFKQLFELLSDNPLLRSRLYDLRTQLADGKKISEYLTSHEQRVRWQIKRLQRTRNIATHIGAEGPGIETIANHLHNYFDYVINYILCKMENDDYIESVSTVILECELDNVIHLEALKNEDVLSGENYIPLLFGPDNNLVKYKFELG